MSFPQFYGHKYSPVNDDEEEINNTPWGSPRFLAWPKRNSIVVLLVFAGMLGGIFGFALGRTGSFQERVNPALALQKVIYSFRYNISYTEEPSLYTDQLWSDLFPMDGGFFVHSTIAPTRTTFSSFHQLHCLNGLRQAYWQSHKAAVHGEKINEVDLPKDLQPHHVQHCIDLLRQTLMCHADTTLEVADEAGGVDGFRTKHQCRSWEQLVQWTSAQQMKWPGQNSTTT
ncbi:hypothetical protein F5Y09DRAFT_301917 [Xylaria sp. FL1042]|nr:hypothetical protein F5Y09DRAFT_301917 [Xylaria sp. FL1042]